MKRIHLLEDLIPISDFRIRTAKIIAKVRKTKRPLILTQRGRSAVVLEDIREYEKKEERLELLDRIRSRRLTDMTDLSRHLLNQTVP